MPGMGGQETARLLRERFPDIRILFTSGYTEDIVARREMLREGSSFLEKPFSVSDLSHAVHRTLEQRSRRLAEHHSRIVTQTTV